MHKQPTNLFTNTKEENNMAINSGKQYELYTFKARSLRDSTKWEDIPSLYEYLMHEVGTEQVDCKAEYLSWHWNAVIAVVRCSTGEVVKTVYRQPFTYNTIINPE